MSALCQPFCQPLAGPVPTCYQPSVGLLRACCHSSASLLSAFCGPFVSLLPACCQPVVSHQPKIASDRPSFAVVRRHSQTFTGVRHRSTSFANVRRHSQTFANWQPVVRQQLAPSAKDGASRAPWFRRSRRQMPPPRMMRRSRQGGPCSTASSPARGPFRRCL